MTRYEVFLAHHEPDEAFHAWLSARLSEWATPSGRAAEIACEHRQGRRFPVLVTDAHHAAFDRFLQDWLLTIEPKDYI